MVHFWEHLLNTALLGTDKQSLDETLLPENIRQHLHKADKSDRESFVYTVASLVQHYEKGGTRPDKLELLTIHTAEAEDKAYAPSQAVAVLKTILTLGEEHPSLVEYWLDGCIKNGWLAPPELVVSLLNLGTKTTYKALQEKIAFVTGNRGRWMTQFNEAWNYLQPPAYTQQWEEGTRAQREEILTLVRQRNPEQARQWLEKSWEEESSKDKAAFVPILGTHLSPADEPFLQKIWDEIQLARRKKKDMYADLLLQTTTLLLRLPDSKLSLMVWEKTKKYLHKTSTKKLMGLLSTEHIQITLPQAEDDFLNKEMFWYTLGLQEKSGNDLYTDIESWFYTLLSYIPPTRWESHLESTPDKLIMLFNTEPAFLKDKKGSRVALYTVALAKAADFHAQAAWARAWVHYFKQHYKMQQNNVSYLYQYLDNEELERFYEEHIDIIGSATDAFLLRNVLTDRKDTHHWSLPFTQFIFKNLSKNLYYLTQDISFISKAIGQIHPSILQEDLAGYLPDTTAEWNKKQWQERTVHTFRELMSIRLEMEAIFAK